jgi:lipid-binding SYLF domain-containing protein
MKTEKPLMYPRADVSPPVRLLACLLAFVALALPVSAQAKGREDARVIVATQVMDELRAQRDQYIPDRLLERAYGIAVVPDVKKGAVGFGLRGGKGVLVVRDKQGRLSNPVFITLAGGSFGWQLGVQSTDLVLVFTTRAGIDGITDGKLTLGGDASVAAGPVGRSASASTDTSFRAEIYSYSRSSGIFAGLALDGTAISIDRKANAAFYGQRRVEAADIMSGSVTRDSDLVRKLLAALATGGSTPSAPATAPSASAPVTAAPATPSAPATGGTQSFPMEDAAPGQDLPKN